jgi:CIC family chloride channel protein
MTFVGLLVGTAGYFYADIFGIGYEAVNKILAAELSWEVVLILLALKFFLVPLILQSGGFGGIFAPSLFMGATFGYLFAIIVNTLFNFQLDPTSFVLVGMGAVLGGVNTIPIASILIIFEMTRNYEFILPLMFAVVLSTMIVQFVMKGSVHLRQLEKQGYSLVSGRESSILRQIPVKEIMRHDVVLISENTPLPKVISQLLDSHHGTFYTVDENNSLVGSISETELRPMITEYEYLREMLIAGDIARPEVLTVSENDNLDHTLKLFGKVNVDEFPVVSSTNPSQVIGSIWRQDVISCYNRESLKYNMADGIAYELKDIKKTGKSVVAGGYSIVERKVPSDFMGKTLSELRIRNRFGLEVMMIKQASTIFDDNDEDNLILPGPDYVIKEDDTLILFGEDEKIAQTNEWGIS